MMMGGGGGFGGGGGRGGGGKNNGCKWCAMGECWGCSKTGGKSGSAGGNVKKLEALGAHDCTEEEAEQFLAENPELEEKAVKKFKALNKKLQKLVIQRGDMSSAKDKTAVLLTRMKKVGSVKPGDWICSACGDLQFAKNDSCRQCSAPKP